jgi:hypothetical protein
MLRELTQAEIEGTRRRIRLQWEEPAQTTPSEQVLLDQVGGLLSEAGRKVSWTLGTGCGRWAGTAGRSWGPGVSSMTRSGWRSPGWRFPI